VSESEINPQSTAQDGANPAQGPAQSNGSSEAPSAEAAAAAKIQELENKYKYLYAEFENYKKRVIKERSDIIKFGWENVARDLLQVTDNLERAIAHIPAGTDKALVDGLQMVLTHFKSTLQKQGVQEIQAVGQNFNPELHEAMAQETSDQPAGLVCREHSKGYTLHGRLLRPSRVAVSSGKAG
jgi:molecular chaperone GrpE